MQILLQDTLSLKSRAEVLLPGPRLFLRTFSYIVTISYMELGYNVHLTWNFENCVWCVKFRVNFKVVAIFYTDL